MCTAFISLLTWTRLFPIIDQTLPTGPVEPKWTCMHIHSRTHSNTQTCTDAGPVKPILLFSYTDTPQYRLILQPEPPKQGVCFGRGATKKPSLLSLHLLHQVSSNPLMHMWTSPTLLPMIAVTTCSLTIDIDLCPDFSVNSFFGVDVHADDPWWPEEFMNKWGSDKIFTFPPTHLFNS